MVEYLTQAYLPLIGQQYLSCGDSMSRETLAWHVNRSLKKIGIFSIDYYRFQTFQYRKMHGFMRCLTQLHKDRTSRSAHYMGIENTGSQGRHTQTQGIFVAILILYQQSLVY